jgi:hypothetical protein
MSISLTNVSWPKEEGSGRRGEEDWTERILSEKYKEMEQVG